jgi:hypothetical protein
VNSAKPSTNYGTKPTLRADASPVERSYLRFDVQGLTGTITQVTLRVFANSASATGHTVSGVTDNTWTETGINFSNAPPVGSAIGSLGSFSAGTWTEVNVTAYVTGNGVLNVVLTTPSSTAINYASRQSANAPQLVMTVAP